LPVYKRHRAIESAEWSILGGRIRLRPRCIQGTMPVGAIEEEDV
jgi:hypothetical protein